MTTCLTDIPADAAHSPDEAKFAESHFRRNMAAYMAVMFVAGLVFAFGDPSILIPNLALRLGARPWVAVLLGCPSLSYVPAFFMAWLMRPEVSRRNAYMLTLVMMYLPLLIAAAPLAWGKNRDVMVASLVIGNLLYNTGMGLTVIPCWDLFAKIFPAGRREKVVGNAQALSTFLSFFSAISAAWLISDACPVPYPRNYALAIFLFTAGGLATAGMNVFIREYRHPPEHVRELFSAYVRDLWNVVTADRALKRALIACMFGAVMSGVTPLLLTYARSCRGFADEHVSWLIAIRACASIPASILFGGLAARFGPQRVAAGQALLTAIAAVIIPLFHGAWQIAPMLIGASSTFLYSYSLLAIMNLAPARKNHRYMALFFIAIILPSLLPVALGALPARLAPLMLAIVAGLALACAGTFWGCGRRKRAGGTGTSPFRLA